MSGFVVSVVGALFAVSAFVFDGARVVAARAALDDHAANAARAAAQEIIDVRLDNERIDPVRGRSAATAYLARHGMSGSIRIDGLRVEVALTEVLPMTLLRIIGVQDRRIATVREVVVVDQ